jgi:hypothetical protein
MPSNCFSLAASLLDKFDRAYCNRKPAIPAAIGIANDVPALSIKQLVLVCSSQRSRGQAPSIASPMTAKLSPGTAIGAGYVGSVPAGIADIDSVYADIRYQSLDSCFTRLEVNMVSV